MFIIVVNGSANKTFFWARARVTVTLAGDKIGLIRGRPGRVAVAFPIGAYRRCYLRSLAVHQGQRDLINPRFDPRADRMRRNRDAG